MHDYFVPAIRRGTPYSGHALVESWFSQPTKKLWRYESNGILVRSAVEPEVEGAAVMERQVLQAQTAGQVFNFKLSAIPLTHFLSNQKHRTPVPHDDTRIRTWLYARATACGFIPVRLDQDSAWVLIKHKDDSVSQRTFTEFSGALRVTDVALFNKTLESGVSGTPKYLGCSLLLISNV